MAKITLFAEGIAVLGKENIRKIIRRASDVKHRKGYGCRKETYQA